MAENASHPGYPSCFDPYLRYGIRTDFADFAFFDDKDFKLFFLVTFKEPAAADEFAKEMGGAGFEIRLDPILEGERTRYRTLHSQKSAVTNPRAFHSWERYVDRVELSLPLKPNMPSPIDRITVPVQPRWQGVAEPPGELLIGLLDDGCPFAAAQFMKTPASTRVLAIWDQNPDKAPAHIKDAAGDDCRFGMPLQDFGWGLEYWRDFAVPGNGPQRQIGIDEWISLHLTPAHTIDEAHIYSDADFGSLAFRESHGAHVMDVLAGKIPPSSRVGPTGSNTDHRDPPSWAPGTDPASRADLVFVQFPKSGILDASGIWLNAYVIPGIEYILSFAGPQTRNVVINLSYGPATGPHDGTAPLEAALSQLVAYYDGVTNQPKLDIFLAAGNFYLTDTHIAYLRHRGHSDTIQWTWRLLPDNPVTCFSEVWMDSGQTGGVTVTLTPPGGAPVVINTQILGNSTMWQLNVAPTLIAPNVPAAAPHGDYTVRVAGIPQYAKVDAYAARTEPNLGVISLAKRSYFVDPSWERTRSAAADCRYLDGEFDNSGSLIKRAGTLNGIATANVHGVHVAGGDMIGMGDGRKSPYASAGPARGNPAIRRIGPDYALFSDESYALEGVRAGGSRGGAVFRLIGTSAAAPQLARLVANSANLQADYPTTNTLQQEQRGQGDLEPP